MIIDIPVLNSLKQITGESLHIAVEVSCAELRSIL